MDEARRTGGRTAPEFFLYGEPSREVDKHFLHLESLDERNRPANWNIHPHSHAQLHHLFHMAAGAGRMHADGMETAFVAPCLLLVPAGSVHGFVCEEGTRGSVLTIARSYLGEFFGREPALRALFEAPGIVPLPERDIWEARLTRLRSELAWTAQAHALVVEALVTMILVDALRLAEAAPADLDRGSGRHAALLARFRALVEAHYRSDMKLDAYLGALNATPKRLRTACERIAGCTPSDLINDRRLLEAKRLLLYSNVGVAEVAYYLGFSDAAYFSRFFAQRCGLSPRAFRAEAASVASAV